MGWNHQPVYIVINCANLVIKMSWMSKGLFQWYPPFLKTSKTPGTKGLLCIGGGYRIGGEPIYGKRWCFREFSPWSLVSVSTQILYIYIISFCLNHFIDDAWYWLISLCCWDFHACKRYRYRKTTPKLNKYSSWCSWLRIAFGNKLLITIAFGNKLQFWTKQYNIRICCIIVQRIKIGNSAGSLLKLSVILDLTNILSKSENARSGWSGNLLETCIWAYITNHGSQCTSVPSSHPLRK